jgi:hypothetical protein
MVLTSEIEFWPAHEVKKLMAAFEKARAEKDMDSLLWCADRMLFLYRLSEEGEIEPSADQVEMLFDKAFQENLQAPALIADLVAPDKEEPEPITAKEAGEALETVREYLEESMAKKGLAPALKNLESIRGAVSALAGEEAE